MDSDGAIEIKMYEPWMLEDLARLRQGQYGESIEANRSQIERQFFHEFARDSSFIIVAQDGNTIVGMLTYTYWPYSYRGETYYSVQSGMLLVDKEYRRRGLFSRLALKADEVFKERQLDFVTGFPVPASLPGSIKAGALHIGTPKMIVRPLKPLKLISYKLSRSRGGTSEPDMVDNQPLSNRLAHEDLLSGEWRRVDSADAICMKADRGFIDYRYGGKEGKYKIYRYGAGGQDLIFICKMNFLDGVNMLYIGDILVNGDSAYSLGKAIAWLIKDVRKEGNIDAIAIMLNTRRRGLFATFLRKGFLSYPSEGARMIVLPVSVESSQLELITDYSNWNAMWSDVDSWYI